MTIGEVLDLAVLKSSKLLTDREVAKGRKIRWVSVIEIPVERFIRRHEMVMSTGMNVGRNVRLLASFVREVAAAGASALGLAVGHYTPTIPRSIIDMADQLGLPLLELRPWELSFSEISEAILKRLMQEQFEAQSRSEFVWALAHRSISEEMAAVQGRKLGHDLRPSFAAVVAQMQSSNLMPSEDAYEQVSHIERLCGKLAANKGLQWLGAVAGDRVLGYLQLRRTETEIRPFLNSVQSLVSASCRFSWGIGRKCKSLPDFAASYEDARTACEIGSRVHGAGSISDLSDVLLDRVLLRLNADPDVCRLLSRYIAPVTQIKRIPLLHTIEVFLEHGCNASQTARSLSITRQSVLYRLDKISSLVKIDFHSRDDVFALALSVRLHRLRERTNLRRSSPIGVGLQEAP
jgi:DNA-binding PucR family transcriptional regulator